MIRFFSNNKQEWFWFICSFTIYSTLCFAPKILALNGIYFTSPILKEFYDIGKNLSANITAGILFFLIFQTFQENREIKNKLEYILAHYNEMKKRILTEIMRALSSGLKVIKDSDLQDIHLYPRLAQKYFTYEQCEKIFSSLDDKSIRTITRSMSMFLEESNHIKHHFIKNGDFSLAIAFNHLKDDLYQIEEWQENGMGWDWCEDSTLKSCNPLYRLFCDDVNGKDKISEIILDALKKYK